MRFDPADLAKGIAVVAALCVLSGRGESPNGAKNGEASRISLQALTGLPRFDDLPSGKERDGGSLLDDDVVVLPSLTIEGEREVDLPERASLTLSGVKQLFQKRYPGATLPGADPERESVPNYALLMYRDDVRLRDLAALSQIIALDRSLSKGDRSKTLDGELQRAKVRLHDWRTEGMDRSVNHWRR